MDKKEKYYPIEIRSCADISMAEEGFMETSGIKVVTANARREFCPYMIIITKDVKDELSLAVLDILKLIGSEGEMTEAEICGPVNIRFGNNELNTQAVYIPGSRQVVIGFDAARTAMTEDKQKNHNPYMDRNSLR